MRYDGNMDEVISASEQIDAIIKNHDDWQGEMLSRLRAVVMANPAITEEVKWKKPSRPEGVAVWAYGGNVCIGEILKNAVRLTFPKGAQIADTKNLFNTRLDSKTVRAIDFTQGAPVDEPALSGLIAAAIKLNS